jgi:hypothetical protein
MGNIDILLGLDPPPKIFDCCIKGFRLKRYGQIRGISIIRRLRRPDLAEVSTKWKRGFIGSWKGLN